MKSTLSLFFLSYLRFFARLQLAKIKLILHLQRKNMDIIGVTGSAGKSSTVRAISTVLSPHFATKNTSESNSESGIPLNILGLSIKNYSPINWIFIFFATPFSLIFNWKIYQIYIVEMGIDSPNPPKNMDYLLSIIRPNIAVFLNVNSVHAQFFSSLDQIAQEKTKLINSLPQTGYAFINLSDPLIQKYVKTKAKIIPIKKQPFKLKKKFPPVYQISFNTALQIASLFQISSTQAIHSLNLHFNLPPGRSTILPGLKNNTIIDSSYNSSPTACLAMLDFLSTFPAPRLAVLGDMRELGKSSPLSHRQIYQKALKTSDTIISVGPETKKYFGPKAIKFDFWWQASDYLQCHPAPAGSTILIKGSQNTIYLEELVKSLLKNPSDSKKLCRQSPYWLKTKQNFRLRNSPAPPLLG
ncbi:hypothetical protein KJ909_03545 [Patescibacteria group bacterium]|nr:hypothetical protein [Patescibacteria group bacterium]